MMTRTRLSALLAILVLSLLPAVLGPSVQAGTYAPERAECELLALINTYRVANGRTVLKLSPTLGAAAEFHSHDMIDHDYFSHAMSDGTTWADNIAAHGYPTQSARAENLAAGHQDPAQTLAQWKGSPSHNSNILDARMNAIGIGRASSADSDYVHYWTTTFGSLVDATVSCAGYTEPAPKTGQPIEIVGGGRTGLSSPSTNVYDGRTSTSWVTTWDEPRRAGYVYVDLGSIKQVSKIQWYFTRGGMCDRFSVQVSNDKETWTTLTTRGTAYAGSWRSVAHTGRARYVRFFFENPNRDAQVGYLAEIRVYT